MYLDMVSDWRVQGASIRSVCECFVKFWHQEPCQYSTCPPSLWRTLAFLIDNGDRWEGTFIISVCESLIMIGHLEPCQDSTCPPSLFLESRRTWTLVQFKNRKFLYFTSWHVTWYEEFYVHFKQLNNNCNVEFHEQGRFDLYFCFLLPLSVIIRTNTNSSYLLILNKQTLLLDFSFNMTALQ